MVAAVDKSNQNVDRIVMNLVLIIVRDQEHAGLESPSGNPLFLGDTLHEKKLRGGILFPPFEAF